MKKTIIVLLFAIITAFTAIAQDNEFSVEGGYIPSAGAVDWSNASPLLSLSENVFYLDLTTRIFFLDYLYVGGSCTTYMSGHTNDLYFFPIYMSYVFNAGLKINNIEFGYVHRCSHGVAAIGYIQEPLVKLDSSSDRVFIKATFKF